MATPNDTWHVPFELLGHMPVAAPRVVVRIAHADALVDFGGGIVSSSRSFEPLTANTLQPAEGGLYDEDTFGPLPRTPTGSVPHDTYEVETLGECPQVRRPGAIVLASRVLHPWLRRLAPQRIGEQTGLPHDEIEGLLSGSLARNARGEIVDIARIESTQSATYGAEALKHAARAHNRWLEALHVLPVLPAGLRRPIIDGERVLLPDLTILYAEIVEANEAAFTLEEEGAPPNARASAAALLQRTVDAALFDGRVADDRTLAPLAERLRREGRDLGPLGKVTDFESFVATLRGPLYQWRAALEASALEVLLLTKKGTIDHDSRERILVDNAAGRFEDVYSQILGPAWHDLVAHGAEERGLPHVDVTAFEQPEVGAPAMLLTGGMSRYPMAPGPGSDLVELVSLVRADLDRELAGSVMMQLLALSLFPYRRKTFLNAGHDVTIGRPLVPESKLRAWVLLPFDNERAWRLSDALPTHPYFLLAVAITEAEQAFKLEHGSAALGERLAERGALVLDPFRESIV